MTHIVVGAGEAGLHAALALRGSGYDGPLIIVGEEEHPPYTRPPLSKSILTSVDAPVPIIRSAAELVERRIGMKLGTRVVAIDRQRKSVVCADREQLRYSKLILATGSRARRLRTPGADTVPVRYLRTLDDALALRPLLRKGARVALIGGGYIGLEIAAAARQLGCEVVILEFADTLMCRVVGREVSAFLRGLHADQGVAIRTGERIQMLRSNGSSVEILCETGSPIAADLVIAGVGSEPCVELAQAAGLAVDNGIQIDEFGRTSDPHIYACGDVASQPNPLLGRRVRLESWQNAQQQASAVGASVAGNPRPYAKIPWFWSDQYDVNLQMVGYPVQWDEVVIRGDVRNKSFTALYLDDGVVVAGNAINRPKDIGPIRSIIEKKIRIPKELLVDSSIPMSQVIKGVTRRIENAA